MQNFLVRIRGLASVLTRARFLFQSGDAGKEGLAARTARSFFWVFISLGAGKVISVLRSVVLARLLLPRDFGITALADIATGFLLILVEIGVAPALIQKQETSDEVLSTAWIISVVRGLLLGAATFLVATVVAQFYDTPELVLVLRVMALLFVIAGFNSTGPILLQKEMDFQKLALFDLASNSISLAVTVVLALVFKNYWALVFGQFAQTIIVLAASYLIHPFRPRLIWRPQAARDILNYGKYIFGGGIVSYFLTQGDQALVGKVVGVGPLGHYRMAFNMSNLPSTSITHVIGQVAFPAYAKIQDNIPALRQAYLNMLKLTCLLAVPLSGGMMVMAPELVKVVFGPEWIPMIPSFIVLCIYGLERAVNASVSPLFKAKGKPNILFYLSLVKLVLLAAIIYPLTLQYGILGTSIASSIVAIIISLNVLLPVSRTLECKVSVVVRPLAGPFSATAVMALTLLGLKALGWVPDNLLSLLAMVVCGAVVYFLSLLVFDRETVNEVKRLAATYLKPAGEAVAQ